jgi:hypothetical protein
MEPTNQFSSEMEYEKLLNEIDQILFVAPNGINLTPKQSQSDGLAVPGRKPSLPSLASAGGSASDLNDAKGNIGTRSHHRRSSEASAQFLQQLEDHSQMLSPNVDPSWAVPEGEERAMVAWVNSKLSEQIPSPVGISHCLGEDGEDQSKGRTVHVTNVGKDFRTGVALLQLLQVSIHIRFWL